MTKGGAAKKEEATLEGKREARKKRWNRGCERGTRKDEQYRETREHDAKGRSEVAGG